MGFIIELLIGSGVIVPHDPTQNILGVDQPSEGWEDHVNESEVEDIIDKPSLLVNILFDVNCPHHPDDDGVKELREHDLKSDGDLELAGGVMLLLDS